MNIARLQFSGGITPYTDPSIIARCNNPTIADFPSLQKYFKAASVQPDGTLICPLSGMVVNKQSPSEPWRASGNTFWMGANDAHILCPLANGSFQCGTKDAALIVSGYSPSTTTDGSNILVTISRHSSPSIAGNKIATRTTYTATPASFKAVQSEPDVLTNYINTSFYDVADTPIRNVAIAMVARQSANTAEHYIGDSNIVKMYTPSSIVGVNSNLGSLSTELQVNGHDLFSTRMTGIYFFSFINGAPSQTIMQSAMAWMGPRSDGALYPGFIGL